MRIKPIKMQPLQLIPAKARIIARLKADGAIFVPPRHRTEYCIQCASSDMNKLHQFSDDLKGVYGLDVELQWHRSGKKPSKLLPQIRVRSKLAFMDLQKYGPFGSRKWRVPREITRASRKIQAEFLRTFFEDEGSVIVREKEVRLYSINFDSLEELLVLLRNFGIKGKLKKGFGAKRNVFAIVIEGKNNLAIFKKEINFWSCEKCEKLMTLLSSYIRR